MVALPDLIVLLQFIIFIDLMKLDLYIESWGVGVRFSETREILHTHAEASHDLRQFGFSSNRPRFHTCCGYPLIIFL